jgi:predicted transcriptional regulator of viral defense system
VLDLRRESLKSTRGFQRIRHAVYVSRVGVFTDTLPDPLLIGSRLAHEYVIAYHSALEAHGVAHAPFRRVTLLSAQTPFRVEYRGNDLVTVTSRERTLVDCLDGLKWAGGIEEVLRSVGGFPSLNVDGVIAYLDLLGSASTAARVGWVLSADPDLWKVTPAELAALRSRLGKGPCFLDDRSRSNKLVPEWRLYVPEYLDPTEELRG